MTTLLPRDDDNFPIPAMRLVPDGAHTITVTDVSARNATAFAAGTRVIGLYATGPVYIRTGDASATAATTDHYLPGGFYYDISLGSGAQGHHTHIAAVRASNDCTLYVSEKQ